MQLNDNFQIRDSRELTQSSIDRCIVAHGLRECGWRNCDIGD